jgi:hypothetical protein
LLLGRLVCLKHQDKVFDDLIRIMMVIDDLIDQVLSQHRVLLCNLFD